MSTKTTTSNASNVIPDKQRVTIFLKPSILKHAKAEAVLEGMTLTQYVEKAIVAFLPVETVVRKPNL